jgi:hypothetical protein
MCLFSKGSDTGKLRKRKKERNYYFYRRIYVKAKTDNVRKLCRPKLSIIYAILRKSFHENLSILRKQMFSQKTYFHKILWKFAIFCKNQFSSFLRALFAFKCFILSPFLQCSLFSGSVPLHAYRTAGPDSASREVIQHF